MAIGLNLTLFAFSEAFIQHSNWIQCGAAHSRSIHWICIDCVILILFRGSGLVFVYISRSLSYHCINVSFYHLPVRQSDTKLVFYESLYPGSFPIQLPNYPFRYIKHYSADGHTWLSLLDHAYEARTRAALRQT